jgi:hypothetical protein
VLSSDLPGVNPTTLNGMVLYYRLMTKRSGSGDSTELSRVGLSHLMRGMHDRGSAPRCLQEEQGPVSGSSHGRIGAIRLPTETRWRQTPPLLRCSRGSTSDVELVHLAAELVPGVSHGSSAGVLVAARAHRPDARRSRDNMRLPARRAAVKGS